MLRIKRHFAQAAAAVLSTYLIAAAVPPTITAAVAAPMYFNYQGRLKKDGKTVNDFRYFRFRLTDETGVSEYYTSGSTRIYVTNGLFNYKVGPLGGVNFAANPLYIEVSVGESSPDNLLLPREALISSPYAIYAASAAYSVDSGALSSRNYSAFVSTRAENQTIAGVKTFTGSVGIGTTTPSTKLDVNGEVSFGGTDWGNLYGYTNGGLLTYQIAASGGNTFFNGGGNVGIGTATPTATLHVNGSFNLLPAGLVVAYGGTSDPDGWLICDGRAVSRSTYSALFAAVGTAFGSGDGSTTFNIPDFRGRFLRGRDADVDRDPDRTTRTAMASGGNTGDAVGSVQADEFKSHAHGIYSLSGTGTNVGNYTVTNVKGDSSSATGGNETRPVNAYVNFIIKY